MSRVSLGPRSNSTLLPILSPHAGVKLAVAKLFISADFAAASVSNLITFGHSASKLRSACGATTRHSISSGDEPETAGIAAGKCVWRARSAVLRRTF